MAFITTVSVDGASYTILPGTLVFDAVPVVVTPPNEPPVVTGKQYQGQFEVDQEVGSALVASTQGAGAVDIEISGFPTVNDAVMDINTAGEGIQKYIVRFNGSQTVA